MIPDMQKLKDLIVMAGSERYRLEHEAGIWRSIEQGYALLLALRAAPETSSTMSGIPVPNTPVVTVRSVTTSARTDEELHAHHWIGGMPVDGITEAACACGESKTIVNARDTDDLAARSRNDRRQPAVA